MRTAVTPLLISRLATCLLATPPTAGEAPRFIGEVQERLTDLQIRAERAAWVQANFIWLDQQNAARQCGW